MKNLDLLMKRGMRLLVIFWLLPGPNVYAQSALENLFALADSTSAFTLNEFYEIILQHHPIAQKANLLSDVARQEVRLARGGFDPKLEATLYSKRYEGQLYYSVFNGALKMPMAIPLIPVIGVDHNQGEKLNPENYLGDDYGYQQLYTGVSIPLGRGLITDERRAALRQANLFVNLTESEQVKMINKLLLEAAKDYWAWYFAYYNYRLMDRNVSIAAEVLEQTRNSQMSGEASGMDTIQARINWQESYVKRQEAWLDFQNSSQALSVYLWDAASNPLQLNDTAVPVRQSDPLLLTRSFLEELINQAKANHPELKQYEIKLKQLDVERKLAVEFLKPTINIDYALINQPVDPKGQFNSFMGNNHKLGIDFSMPIFLRKERAKLGQTKLKITSMSYDLSLAQRNIFNELNMTYNRIANLQTINEQQYEMMLNYERLLQAELLNLRQGESDLFKINLRQEKFMLAQSKWLKTISEIEKEKAYLFWAAGSNTLNRSGS